MSKNQSGADALKKALILGALLVLSIILLNNVEFLTQHLFSSFEEGEIEESTFIYNAEEQNIIRAEISGLWTHNSIDSSGVSRIKYFDITPAGYLYAHAERSYPLPSGEKFTYKLMREDLLTPYAFKESAQTHIIEQHFLNRRYIWSENDTCLFDVRQSEEFSVLVDVKLTDNDILIWNDLEFTRSDKKASEFFPIESGRTIDSYLTSRGYYTCTNRDVPRARYRDAIIESTKSLEYSNEAQKRVVEEFYVPKMLHSLNLRLPFGAGEPFTLTIKFNRDGSVAESEISGRLAASRAVRQAIQDEVQRWRGIPSDEANSVIYRGILP